MVKQLGTLVKVAWGREELMLWLGPKLLQLLLTTIPTPGLLLKRLLLLLKNMFANDQK